MTTAEKNFEDLKEFLDSLYDTTLIKRNLKKNGESFIQEVLALVTSEKDKSEISMLYSYYVENGSELVIRSINEFAHSHKLHDALAVFPLTDDDVTGLVDQAVSNILFYDRKGDEEINIERIEAHFKNNPDAIDVMVAKFRQSLVESLNNESEPEALDDEA
jgi:hypothetical protein